MLCTKLSAAAEKKGGCCAENFSGERTTRKLHKIFHVCQQKVTAICLLFSYSQQMFLHFVYFIEDFIKIFIKICLFLHGPQSEKLHSNETAATTTTATMMTETDKHTGDCCCYCQIHSPWIRRGAAYAAAAAREREWVRESVCVCERLAKPNKKSECKGEIT